MDCQCATGYKGAITWNGATASGTCVKTQCTDLDPDTLRFVSVTKDRGNEHGSKAIFTCENEFTLVGPRSITCDAPSEDAPWPTPPYCTGRLRSPRLQTVTYREQIIVITNLCMLKLLSY